MRLSAWLAMRCAEPEFQEFIGARSKDDAAQRVREICGLVSRAEIDSNKEAEARFHELIRKPFSDFMNDRQQGNKNDR